MRPWGDLKPSHRIAVFDLVDEPPPGALPRIGGQPERITITHVVSQTDLVAFLLFQAQEGNLGCGPAASLASPCRHPADAARRHRAAAAPRCHSAPWRRWAGCAATW